jgi:hypothetical protein
MNKTICCSACILSHLSSHLSSQLLLLLLLFIIIVIVIGKVAKSIESDLCGVSFWLLVQVCVVRVFGYLYKLVAIFFFFFGGGGVLRSRSI